MVIKSWGRRERFNTPRECIEAQLKYYKIARCFYFFHEALSFTSVWDSGDANHATPEEMLELAVEQFNKYGYVAFEGFSGGHALFELRLAVPYKN